MPITISDKLYDTASGNRASSGVTKIYAPIQNYIYLYHTDTLLLLPTYPENITDNSQANFSNVTPLARSAPIFSFSNAGPRSIQFSFSLHREMMNQVNIESMSSFLNPGDDYVDLFIKQIQAAVLPNYGASEKMVDPPMVAVRVGPEVFIKGVIAGSIGITYQLPILKNDKYAVVEVSFPVTEVTPYDSSTILQIGSYRETGDVPLNTSLETSTFVLPKTNINKITARI